MCVNKQGGDEFIRVLPIRDHLQGQEAVQSNVPRLVDLCGRALVAAASPGFVCSALALVEMLGPALDGVASSLIGYLARHLEEAMCADSEGFQALSAPLLSELLGNPCLVS